MILERSRIFDKVYDLVRTEQKCRMALKQASDEYIAIFEEMDSEYLKERALDIRDVTLRLLRNLSGIEDNSLLLLKEPAIIIANDLTPSDTAQMDKDKVIGFITEEGGKLLTLLLWQDLLEILQLLGLTVSVYRSIMEI